MYNSISKINEKYDELIKKLETKEVVENIKLFTKITREANSIKDIARVFKQYINTENNLLTAKELLNEKDKDIIELAKNEIDLYNEQMKKYEDELKILILPKDESDERDVIIEIRGAAGGDEANIFAGDLFKMYSKWGVDNGYKIKIIDSSTAVAGGFTQIVFSVKGERTFAKLKFESGAHRVQRIPVTETQGRIHTSTATVTVIPEIDDDVEIEINPQDIKIDTYRSSGAGGQSVNTTDSAVRITHIPSGIVVSSQDERSQIQNRAVAMTILKSKLYELEIQKKQAEEKGYRKLAGHGDRSEKIRTYNYPQDRVTDHRIGFSTSLKVVVEGKLNPIIDALLAEEQKQKIEEVNL